MPFSWDKYRRNTDDYAPGWRPEPDESIEGTIVTIAERENGTFGAYPIFTIEKSDGESTSVHAMHANLQQGLAAINAQEGDRVRITYYGKVQKSNPKGVYMRHEYDVERLEVNSDIGF